MFSAGVGSRSRFFKIAGVGVGFSKMLESGVGVVFLKLLESVFQNCWSRNPKKSSDSTTLVWGVGISIVYTYHKFCGCDICTCNLCNMGEYLFIRVLILIIHN